MSQDRNPPPEAGDEAQAGGLGWLLLAACNLGAAALIGVMAWALGQGAKPMESVPGGAAAGRQAEPPTPAPAPAAAAESLPAWARPAELSPHRFELPHR